MIEPDRPTPGGGMSALAVIYLAYLSQYACYLSWNPFIPLSREIFGLTMGQAGTVAAAVALGRICFQIPGGLLVDRFSARPLLVGSLLLLGGSAAMIGLRGSYGNILLGQFLISSTGVLIWPLCVKFVIDRFPRERQDAIAGLLNTSTTVAIILTNLLVPYLIFHWSWRAAFFVIGAFPVLVSLLVPRVMRSSPGPDGPRGGIGEPRRKLRREDFQALFRSGTFLRFIFVYSAALYTSWGLNTWLPAYLVKRAGFSIVRAGGTMFWFGLLGCVAMPAVGLLTRGDHRKRCRYISGSSALLALLVFVLPLVRGEAPVLRGCVAAMGFLSFGYMGPLNLMVGEVAPRGLFGTAMAVLLFLWQIASMIQSLAVGGLLDLLGSGVSYDLALGIVALGSLSAAWVSRKI